MVCIPVIHFISSLFLLYMEIHLFFNIINNSVYFRLASVEKKFAKGRSVVSFPKRHLQIRIFVVYVQRL